MKKQVHIWEFFILLVIITTFGFLSMPFGPTGADTMQTGTASFIVIPSVEIDITKTDFPDPVLQGTTLTYFILVNVTGNATNVTVNDTYPPFVTFNGSQPPPTTGNNTWFLGNLSNTTFQINITVNVSSTFTGFLVNNATVFFNTSNGVEFNASDIEVTTVIGPTPPPGGGPGGGSKGAMAGCPTPKAIERKVGDHFEIFYTCCTDEDCEKVWKLKDYYCGKRPEILAAAVCIPIKKTEMPVYAGGICPVPRLCGTLCCGIGEVCYKGKCAVLEEEFEVPAPPEIESYYVLGIKEMSILWLLMLILLAIILLFILVALLTLRKKKKKKKKKK